jgi:hypothetical protein
MKKKPAAALKIKIASGSPESKEFTFTKPFCIGRDDSCEIRIQDKCVSRVHAEVYYREGQWWIRDLSSANGTYIDGETIDRFPLVKPAKIELGQDGPVLLASMEACSEGDMTEVRKGASVTEYMKQYFGGVTRADIGKQTLMIRQAFKRIQKKQKGKYYRIIGGIVILLMASGAFVIYQQKKLREIRELAVGQFYDMKAMELELASLREKVSQLSDVQDQAAFNRLNRRYTDAQSRYDELIKRLNVTKNMSPEDKIIFRLARVFGECEINLPPLFVQEVKKNIEEWKNTKKFEEAISRAQENGYAPVVRRIMIDNGLPPQFFYLALQESEFRTEACGIETKFGIAKGMWQFIPDTAVHYGLKLGPLLEIRRPDSRDERHDFLKSTEAAARYLRDIYDRDAQGSGLLVMASYNWSEKRIMYLKNKLDEIPAENPLNKLDDNPRERNFWRLLERYADKFPRQTYDYVFRIFSAAVIGENPRLFDFDFDNPLIPVQ